MELENGLWRDAEAAARKRRRLQELLSELAVLDFGAREIAAYGAILAAGGFSRRKTADRMTAATALAHGLRLVTLNGRDFRDVPGLRLIAWERPEP